MLIIPVWLAQAWSLYPLHRGYPFYFFYDGDALQHLFIAQTIQGPLTVLPEVFLEDIDGRIGQNERSSPVSISKIS
jgi:hypothetical protein